MGKPNGFMEYKREENILTPVSVRIASFAEFKKPLDEKERMEQAARCMNCGVPFCQSAIELKGKVTGCPLHNLIPEWNDEIYNHHYHHALSRLLKTNPFPEFTGRVCPALCEKACLNGIDSEPVTVHDNELFIIENAFKKGFMEPKVPAVRSSKKIAVIGAGPAGLAAAHDLNERGHNVTVFEREDRPGGLLMYGIPNMKLDKSVIKRRQDLMEAEGVKFVFGKEAGKDISKEELLDSFDAIILACGSKKPRDLNMENRQAEGIYFAVDYLSKATKHLLDGTPFISAYDKDVVIVGGGDTGNDCVATAIRQGASSVTQIEMMPKAPEKRLESNPWPEWPNVLKTDYGQLEAIEKFGHDPRLFCKTVTKALESDGKIDGVEIATVAFKDGKLTTIEGSEEVMPCQMLIIATGFVGIEEQLKTGFDLETTSRNTIATHPDSYQSLEEEKIFTAGDARRGQSLVVWAIHEGKEAAKEVDKFLMGYSNID